jgi:hypothetical protein
MSSHPTASDSPASAPSYPPPPPSYKAQSANIFALAPPSVCVGTGTLPPSLPNLLREYQLALAAEQDAVFMMDALHGEIADLVQLQVNLRKHSQSHSPPRSHLPSDKQLQQRALHNADPARPLALSEMQAPPLDPKPPLPPLLLSPHTLFLPSLLFLRLNRFILCPPPLPLPPFQALPLTAAC